MENFVMIGVCIILGMILKATKSIHPEAHKGINTWVLYIALPAVSFKYLPKVQWSWEMSFPIIATFLITIVSMVLMSFYSKLKGYSNRSRSTLFLISGYSNTSFVGFPLVTAFFGEEYLSIAILCDQTMFFTLSTLGIITSLKGGSKENAVDAKYIVKRLFTFPPFIACLSALVFSQFINFDFAEPFFNKMAATVAPLALFSIGLQLKFNGWTKLIPQLSLAMLYKLIFAPLLVLLAALALNIDHDIAKITIFEAAMPTLVTASIIAEQFRLNTKLTNLTIGMSIIIGFLTTAIWYQIITIFF